MSDVTYIHGTEPDEQRRLGTLNELINPSFLAFLDFDEAHSVLEVGSGLGLLTHEVALRLPEAEIVGVEYSDQQLARVDRTLPNLRFVQGDAHDLQFADNAFDVVYCRCLLEHVAHPVRVIQEMRRVVRPGGRVFVQENDISAQRYDPPVPQFENVWHEIQRLQLALGGDSLIGRSIFRLMKVSGFKNVRASMGNEVYWSGTPGFAMWIANAKSIIEGCADELVGRGFVTRTQIEIAVSELRQLSERDDACSWFYWNRAVGLK